MLKIGPLERCNHKPCVCEGLGGYVKLTEVEQIQVGYGWETKPFPSIPVMRSIFEDVFSYSWLWPRRVGR